jgi:hypothetical protein
MDLPENDLPPKSSKKGTVNFRSAKMSKKELKHEENAVYLQEIGSLGLLQSDRIRF